MTSALEIQKLLFHGCSTLNLVSKASGRTLGYRTLRNEDGTVIWVRCVVQELGKLTTKYLGYISRTSGFKYGGKKAAFAEGSLEEKSFVWLWDRINSGKDLPSHVTVEKLDSCSLSEFNSKKTGRN